MEGNLYCEVENCIFEASAFYFKATAKRKVCNTHLPVLGEKVHPIAQFYFVTTPEDETEFLRRSEEVKEGKETLDRLLNQATGEFEAGLDSLEKAKTRALQVVNDVYEAEKRRMKQHFHQIEVFIEDYNQELARYVILKENLLPEPLNKLRAGLRLPSLMRIRIWENDLELAEVIRKSSFRGGSSFDSCLSVLSSPKLTTLLANHLFQRAHTELDSYIDLQHALEDCTQSEILNPLPETTQLKSELTTTRDCMKGRRANELQGHIYDDTDSIRSVLDLYLKNVSIQKAAGDNLQVEKLYKKALKFALPESQSDVTLDILLTVAQWYTEHVHHNNLELKEILEAALKILTIRYPKAEETMNCLLRLGKLYQSDGQYTAAKENFEKAVALGKAEFANSKETADAIGRLGMIFYRIKKYPDAESHYETALDILNTDFRDSSERAAVYASLGKLYMETNRPAEAEANYQLSVDILRSNFPRSYQLVSTLIEMGRFYKSRRRISEAEKCMMETHEIGSSKDFQDLKPELLDEDDIPSTGEDVQKCVAVFPDQVKCFDVANCRWQQFFVLQKYIDVNISTSSTFIGPSHIVVSGGGSSPCTCHVGNRTYLLGEDGSVHQLPHMRTGRICPGLTWDSAREALYVFAGMDADTSEISLRSSEMYLSCDWLPLPDMHQGRFCFNPCWHSCLVYLCGGYDTNSVETYNPRSNTFALQNYTLPECGSTTTVEDGEVLTVISQQHISKLQRGRLTSQYHSEYFPWSNCTPVMSKGVVYLVKLKENCCWGIILASGVRVTEISFH